MPNIPLPPFKEFDRKTWIKGAVFIFLVVSFFLLEYFLDRQFINLFNEWEDGKRENDKGDVQIRRRLNDLTYKELKNN
uniref:Uncharacterized protein n=1 Tax=Meloidogyne floridensis TaxID=298350 RepID=A0A915NXX5_9BILA